MRTSQTTMLSALGLVMLGIVVLIASARIALVGAADGNGSFPAAIESDANRARLSPDLTDFSGIVVRDGWAVELIRGESWAVEVTAPDDRIDSIEYGVTNGQLHLVAGEKRGFFGWWGGADQSVRATVTMPALDNITVLGAGSIELSGFSGESLAISVEGAANIEADNGRYDRLDLTVEGAGNIVLDGLAVTSANVSLSGATNVELLMAGGELTGRIEGFGNLSYAGTVSLEDVNVAGFANVQPK